MDVITSESEGGPVRVSINDDCQGCGLCEATAPDIFEITDEGQAIVLVDEVPPEREQAVREAAEECPTEAVVISD